MKWLNKTRQDKMKRKFEGYHCELGEWIQNYSLCELQIKLELAGGI